jgi:putative flippase GtrA
MELIQQAWGHRWLRFLVMGAVNTGFSYGIYAVLVYLGLNYALSNLVSLVLGILFSFRTQSKFVFQHARSYVFLRYIGVWAVIYCINVGTIAMLLRLGLNAYIAGALAIIPTAVSSYFLQKLFVFSEDSKH